MDQGKENEALKKGDGPKLLKENYIWTDERIKLLVGIAIETARKGNKVNAAFTKEGCNEILKEYNTKCEKHITLDQLMNRWNILKATWVAWVYLKNKTSGWGWNPATGTVDPPTEEIWNAFVKKHREGRHFKHGPLKNEDEMRELFKCVIADGEETLCPYDDIPRASASGTAASNNPIALDIDDDSNDDDDPDLSKMKRKPKNRSIGGPSKRSKMNINEVVGESLTIMVDLEEARRADKIRSKNEDATIDEAVKKLNSLEFFEEGSEQHLLASEVLEDPMRRQMFNKLSDAARLAWIRRMVKKKMNEYGLN